MIFGCYNRKNTLSARDSKGAAIMHDGKDSGLKHNTTYSIIDIVSITAKKGQNQKKYQLL